MSVATFREGDTSEAPFSVDAGPCLRLSQRTQLVPFGRIGFSNLRGGGLAYEYQPAGLRDTGFRIRLAAVVERLRRGPFFGVGTAGSGSTLGTDPTYFLLEITPGIAFAVQEAALNVGFSLELGVSRGSGGGGGAFHEIDSAIGFMLPRISVEF
jgi:hypothetical protein